MSDKHYLPEGRTRMTAHDVRHLEICGACGELGDDRTMIRCDKIGTYSNYHDECAVNAFGEEILKLPADELSKFTLRATGLKLMKAILDAAD